jgi:hypothetical protein
MDFSNFRDLKKEVYNENAILTCTGVKYLKHERIEPQHP